MADSATNRVVVAQVVALVGARHDLRDDTIVWREKMVRFMSPMHYDTNRSLIHFTSPSPEPETAGLSLSGYESDGKLLASLQQITAQSRRTKAYSEVGDSLVAEMQRRFGDAVTVEESDHLLK
ncbi:MAG TPA: hypothetical protein VFZ59_05525 [Verrucomicrobiae bacterium]|nr:hypothetical protein [Verrucomicrobiae bacterium]